jgi:hypothetical protein
MLDIHNLLITTFLLTLTHRFETDEAFAYIDGFGKLDHSVKIRDAGFFWYNIPKRKKT